jgi:hypothetical protein
MIEKLTKKQKALFPKYVKRWTNIGLSTTRANRKQTEKAIKEVYKISKLDEPKIFTWLESPLECELAFRLIKEASKHTDIYDTDSVWDSVRDSVGDSVGASVWDSVWASVRASVRASVGDSVWDSVWASVRASVGDSVWDSVGDSVGASVRASFEEGILCNYYYGQHDANWIGFYEFFLKELNIKGTEKIKPMITIAENIGWWAPYKNFVLVSEKPTVIHRNEQGRLHSFNGPCLEYKDGFCLYRFNGVTVTKELAEKKEFTKEDILNEKNADVRREIVRKIGIEKVVEILQPKVIDSKYGYDLLLIDLGDKRDRPYLRMKNPSIDAVHIEGVSPEIRNVEAALCWRNGLSQFKQPKQLT